MRKIAFIVGLVSLALWNLWWVIKSAPIDISPMVVELTLHGIFVAACLTLIIFGASGLYKKNHY